MKMKRFCVDQIGMTVGWIEKNPSKRIMYICPLHARQFLTTKIASFRFCSSKRGFIKFIYGNFSASIISSLKVSCPIALCLLNFFTSNFSSLICIFRKGSRVSFQLVAPPYSTSASSVPTHRSSSYSKYTSVIILLTVSSYTFKTRRSFSRTTYVLMWKRISRLSHLRL